MATVDVTDENFETKVIRAEKPVYIPLYKIPIS